MVVEFSIQGASNFIGILFAGIIFLFFWRYAPTLIRARYAIPLLLVAVLGLFPLYLLPTEFNTHGVSIILGYLLLTVGLIVIARSDNRKSQHRWAHGLFLLVAAIGIVFGYRSLVLVILLAYPLYWSGCFFLRNRLRTGLLVATAGLLIGAPIVLLGTSLSDAVETIFGDSVREYTGGRLQSGREVLWRYSLAAISEAPWLGRGPGAVITRPRPDRPADKARDSPPPAQSSDREPSCMDSSNPGLLGDCGVLLEARNTLDGGSAAISSWKPPNLLRSWRGVTLKGDPPRVVAVNLSKVNLRGVVPPELGRLDKLEVLRLSSNVLTGSIPPELGRLTRLRVLALDDNALSGPVPPELGALENLEELSLRGNRLSGAVPSELADLTNLSLLRLAGNDFSDTLPPALYDVASHDLERSLHCPASSRSNTGLINDCVVLLEVRDNLAGDFALDWNDAVPIEFWQGVTVAGTPAPVTELSLPVLGLSGIVPAALSELDRLVKLNLVGNALTGPIPPDLGRLIHIRELLLGGNALSGSIPSQLGGLDQLTLLHLRRNRLTGPIPTELARLAKLRTLALDSNALSGVVPRELAKLPNLEELRLAGNRLDLPLELAAFSEPPASSPDGSLAVDSTVRRVGLDLFCPDADAQADEVAGDCAALLATRDALAGERKLNWNRAVPISAWQGVRLGGQPPRVFAVNLSRAGLTGAIPAELGRLETLVWLDLDGNTLTGSIPAELGMLANLRRLALGGNDLTGFIPPQLGNLSNLEELRLGGNEFTGCLPWELQDIADRELALDLLCDPSMGSGRGLREDISALMEMRDILAGSTKLNWSYATPIASWEGVTVSPVRSVDRGAQEGGTARGTERVIGLDMSGMGLDGHLPPALGSLEKLIWLRLNGNRLSGPIPPELGQLTGLLELGLESNALTGPIPRQIGQLASLSELWLGHNRLSGPIPPELAALDRLSVLHMRGNAFTGCLPPLDKVTNQFRARPDGLPECDAPPSAAFSSLGDVVRRINAAVDPMRFDGIPDSAHNLYLQIGVQMGILGLGALALLCASLIFNLRVRAGAQVTPVHCYAAACTIVVLVCETFDVNLLQNTFTVGCVAWILMGLAAGAVNHDERVAGPPLNA